MSAESDPAQETIRATELLQEVKAVFDDKGMPVDEKRAILRDAIKGILTGPNAITRASKRSIYQGLLEALMAPGKLDMKQVNDHVRRLLASVIRDRERILRLRKAKEKASKPVEPDDSGDKMTQLNPQLPQDPPLSDHALPEFLRNQLPRLKQKALSLVSEISFDPEQAPSFDNKRHLQGLLERLDNPDTRLDILTQIYLKFHPSGKGLPIPEWYKATVEKKSFREVLENIHSISDLDELCALLKEISSEAVMARFDFENTGPREDSRIAEVRDFPFVSRKELEELRLAAEVSILSHLNIESLSDLPAFDSPSGLYSFLFQKGILQGDPVFKPDEADLVTVNLIILQKSIEQGVISAKDSKLHFNAGKEFLFYRRKADNERPHVYLDLCFCRKGSIFLRSETQQSKSIDKKLKFSTISS